MINEQDRIIGEYFDECAQEGFMSHFDEEEQVKLAECLTHWNIRSGDRIFEPGCGSGRLTAVLAEHAGSSGYIMACDVSREMIDRARKRNLPPHVHLYNGSVDSVPADNEFFDMVLCFQVFPHFIDRHKALSEINRVLKPGGWLWINHLSNRKIINDRHRNAGGPVISHKIPDEQEMRTSLTADGFRIEEFSDTHSSYQVGACKYE